MRTSSGQLADVFAGVSLTRTLWPHQVRALSALDQGALDQGDGAQARAGKATYLVVPPGGGKTLIGLEAARRLGRPAVVLCPSTAIQAQWLAQWREAFSSAEVPATASRELPTPLTVLTYQALCTLGAAGTRDTMRSAGRARDLDGDGTEGLLSLLHPNGRELITRLRDGGPWTLVLDECHHLLELWGRLLQAVIGQLDQPRIVGLTATPPHLMTAEQAELHRTLFGGADLEISAPALVREGRLAPYQELAYFTRPSPAEADYIHGASLRFAELRTGLLDPGFASVPFLGWLQARVVERRDPSGAQVTWARFERDEPALAAAAVRLHVAGLLGLPEGASVREQHRHPLTAADWVALIGDYTQRCLLPSEDPRDERALGAIRRALPSVGYRLTRAGVRAGESPVDRVLARSESKARAATEILAAESAELGSRLRALVLCDFEDAGGMTPADLAGVLPTGSGGTRLVLETLLADPQSAALDPVLLTGRRVACGADTAERLIAWLHAAEPGLEVTAAAWGGPAADGTGIAFRDEREDLVEITASPGWEARRYVPLVTRFHAEGGTRCLIGTRALLGEGWDAPAVNVVIDLTAATTPTSVVQARGRGLRRDHGWPGKVADNWGVVCVTGDHPKGAADFDRFARKHDRYFALAASGDIVSGVTHVDPRLSPYAPPPEAELDALNAGMLQRAGQRDAARERWAIGTPYADEPVATVTIATRRPLGLPARVSRPVTRPRPAWLGWAAMVALVGLFGAARTAARLASAPGSGSLDDLAAATADALRAAGLTSRGGDAVQVEAQPDGSYRARLQEVPAAESALFAEALEEVLSPLSQPRYVIPRLILAPPPGRAAAARLALGRLVTGHVPATVVYHAVPTALSGSKKLATAFERAWNTRVGPGAVVYASSPEGTGILAAQRGDDPFALTTQIRTLWR
ncbi:MAG TPA: DEAD/DEAH box helicase family protein [Streptosporangiaceae bacterium]|nr:DEAD/DEAH box helicase family protein [Streptosporangiaceae bacterium]